MSTTTPADRIQLSQSVKAVQETPGAQSRLVEHYLRYLQALLAADPVGLDSVVLPGGRCYDLEAIGLPPGPLGLKMFRSQVNAAIPDERILITAVRFEGDDVIEADLEMTATQTGEIFGIPATGRTIGFTVGERCRFVDGKLAERWAQVDLEAIKRQLSGPA